MRKQSSVTQATQTSPEVPLPSQSTTFPECSVDITREQLMEENECLRQKLAQAKIELAEAHSARDELLHQMKRMALE